MHYEVSQANIVLPTPQILRSKAMKHLLGVRLAELNPSPSRLGGIAMLFWVLHEVYSGKVLEHDGRPFRLTYGLVDIAYGDFGGGADGRWHTDALKWAKQWPQKGIQKRHLLRIKLWYVFFASIGQPLDIEAHRHCDVCQGKY